jgi:hypothetical protein
MEKLNYASWQQFYLQATQETDPEKIHALIEKAEWAIYLRWQELSSSPDHHDERKAIHNSFKELLAIKTNVLKWPGFTQADPAQRGPD